MATTYYSSTFSTGMTTIDCRLELTVNSQDITNNKSNVTVKAKFWRNNSWNGDTYGTGTCYVKINGTEYSQPITPSQSVKQGGIYLFSKTLDIAHNSDGTKTLAMELRATHEMFPVSTKTWSQTLTTIPRASTFTLSSSSVNAGSSTTINITRASSSFTHKAYLSFGSKTWTIGTNIATSQAYTIPNETMNQIPSATSGKGTIKVETYNGSTKLGEKTASITINVPSSIVPSFTSLDITRVDGSVPTAWGIYVQGKSKATLSITGATGTYGSTITAYSISGGGYSATSSSFTTGFLNTTGTNTFTAKITDSRGRTASKTVSITVYEYFAPKITNASVVRCDSNGTETDEGTYLKAIATLSCASCNSKNNVTGKTAYKTLTGSYTGEVAITSGTAKTFGGSVSIDSSYKARITATDSFQTVTIEFDIPTASTTLDFRSGGKGIAIGKVSEKNAFEVGMDAEFSKAVKTYNPITTPNDGGLKNTNGDVYIRNNNSGATIISVNNGTLYLRPRGNLISENETTINSEGLLNCLKLQVTSGGNFGTNGLSSQSVKGISDILYLEANPTNGLVMGMNGTTPHLSPYAGVTNNFDLGVSNSRQYRNLWLTGYNRVASGYCKLPNAMFIQWGSGSGFATGTNWQVTFPIAFPNSCFAVFTTGNYTNSSNYMVYTSALSKTGVLLSKRSTAGGSAQDTVYWFAIGF